MGYCTINEHLDDGQYEVELDYGSAAIDARIATLTAQVAELDANIDTQQIELAAQEIQQGILSNQLNIAIDNYLSATTETDKSEKRELLNEATKAHTRSLTATEKQRNRHEVAILQKASAEAEIARLGTLSVTETKNIWCADYTTDATGNAGTIEINGEQPKILIVPGGEAVTAADGLFTSRDAISAEASYLNAAILPGWQKYSPTYRVGVLTSINRDNDTGSVTLDAASSSAQNLDINQAQELSDVPIEYMTCNSLAFTVFDRVVVKFEGQDWESPKVIGFESNPVPCAQLIARHYTSYFSGFTQEWFHFTLAQGAMALRNALKNTPVPPLADQTGINAYPVQILFRPDGYPDWFEMPIYSILCHDPDAASPYWKDDDTFPNYKPVKWAADGEYYGSHASRKLVDIWDTAPDDVNWETFSYTNNEYPRKLSYEQVDHPIVFRILCDNLFRYPLNWPGTYPPSFDGDLMEIKINTRESYHDPEATNMTWAHFTIKRSTRQVYGANIIDNYDGVIYGGSYELITELTGYEFPP